MKKTTSILIVTLVVSVISSYAASIVAPEDGNWFSDIDPTVTTDTSVDLGGLPAVTISGGQAGPGVIDSLIYRDETTSSDITGNWNSMPFPGGNDAVRSIEFNFYSDGTAYPGNLSIYFGAGGETWFYDVTPPSSSGWNSYYANVRFSDGWYLADGSEDGDESQFLSDLGSVDQAGIRINFATGVENQLYGINDYTLNSSMIPEPHEWVLIAFSLLALGYLFRRQLQEKLDAALVKVRV